MTKRLDKCTTAELERELQRRRKERAQELWGIIDDATDELKRLGFNTRPKRRRAPNGEGLNAYIIEAMQVGAECTTTGLVELVQRNGYKFKSKAAGDRSTRVSSAVNHLIRNDYMERVKTGVYRRIA